MALKESLLRWCVTDTHGNQRLTLLVVHTALSLFEVVSF